MIPLRGRPSPAEDSPRLTPASSFSPGALALRRRGIKGGRRCVADRSDSPGPLSPSEIRLRCLSRFPPPPSKGAHTRREPHAYRPSLSPSPLLSCPVHGGEGPAPTPWPYLELRHGHQRPPALLRDYTDQRQLVGEGECLDDCVTESSATASPACASRATTGTAFISSARAERAWTLSLKISMGSSSSSPGRKRKRPAPLRRTSYTGMAPDKILRPPTVGAPGRPGCDARRGWSDDRRGR